MKTHVWPEEKPAVWKQVEWEISKAIQLMFPSKHLQYLASSGWPVTPNTLSLLFSVLTPAPIPLFALPIFIPTHLSFVLLCLGHFLLLCSGLVKEGKNKWEKEIKAQWGMTKMEKRMRDKEDTEKEREMRGVRRGAWQWGHKYFCALWKRNHFTFLSLSLPLFLSLFLLLTLLAKNSAG